MKPAIWWLPVGAFLIAGIFLFILRRGPEETTKPARTGAAPIHQDKMAAPLPAPVVGSGELESAEIVPPPHEVSPAPPFGFVPPPNGGTEPDRPESRQPRDPKPH
jgi:hypothetical protein